MIEIYLVRHAHSVYSPDEYGRGLSEKGRHDTEYVTELLGKESITVVLSSPYKRAVETVQGTADNAKIPLEIEEEFKERILSSEPVDDFETAINKVWNNPLYAFDGGECNLEAQKRGVNALYHVMKQYDGERVAIGTHGNIMVLMMNYFDKQYDFSFWKQLEMPDIYKLRFKEKAFVDAEHLGKKK